MLTRTSSGPGCCTGIFLYSTGPPVFSMTCAHCSLGISGMLMENKSSKDFECLLLRGSVESSSELIDRKLMIQLTGWAEVLYTCN